MKYSCYLEAYFKVVPRHLPRWLRGTEENHKRTQVRIFGVTSKNKLAYRSEMSSPEPVCLVRNCCAWTHCVCYLLAKSFIGVHCGMDMILLIMCMIYIWSSGTLICLRMTKLSSVIVDLITIIYPLLKNSA
jgi:hypothetical protein